MKRWRDSRPRTAASACLASQTGRRAMPDHDRNSARRGQHGRPPDTDLRAATAMPCSEIFSILQPSAAPAKPKLSIRCAKPQSVPAAGRFVGSTARRGPAIGLRSVGMFGIGTRVAAAATPAGRTSPNPTDDRKGPPCAPSSWSTPRWATADLSPKGWLTVSTQQAQMDLLSTEDSDAWVPGGIDGPVVGGRLTHTGEHPEVPTCLSHGSRRSCAGSVRTIRRGGGQPPTVAGPHPRRDHIRQHVHGDGVHHNAHVLQPVPRDTCTSGPPRGPGQGRVEASSVAGRGVRPFRIVLATVGRPARCPAVQRPCRATAGRDRLTVGKSVSSEEEP
jgi:hypothetical protein